MTAAVAALVLALSGQAAAEDCASARNTLETNACVARRVERADADLTRYLTAARERVLIAAEWDGDVAAGAAIVEAFDQSQIAWNAYVQADCAAVHRYWSSGTIRTVMALNCRERHVRDRAHLLWAQWLTYPDGTPPNLPEPSR